MPKWLQAVMGVFAVVGVAFVAMLLKSSFSAFERSCDTFAVMVVPSPSGKLFAQMENEICDGRTQLESAVWISTDASPRVGSRQWSVFRAPSAQRRGNDYTPLQLRLTWLSDSELQISFPPGTQTQSGESSHNGVKVSYKEFIDRAP